MKNLKAKVSKVINTKSLAIFGWLVIWTAIVAISSAYAGWTLHQSFNDTIKSEVQSLTQK